MLRMINESKVLKKSRRWALRGSEGHVKGLVPLCLRLVGDKTMNYVYLLRCADGSLYCGWTTDLERRLRVHNSGKGAKYTRSRLPVELVYWESFEDRTQALSREWHLKRLSREEKLQLAAGWVRPV